MSERPGRYQRSFSGMIGALVVLLLVIVVFVAFRGSVRDNKENPVEAVEYLDSMPFIRERANFAVLAPPSLPAGWKATTIRFEDTRPQTWHLGVHTDEGRYVGIEQSRDSEAALVDEHVDDEAVEGDTVEVAGHTWTTYTDDGGDTALVRRESGVTILVVGTLSQDELVEYVESLR